MIKSELVQHIAEQNPHLYQRDVEHIVNAILDEISDALARGDRVELRGFGGLSRSRIVPRALDAIPEPVKRSPPWPKNMFLSSKQARKCASVSMMATQANKS